GLDVGEIQDKEGDEFDIKVGVLDNTMNALETFRHINITSLSGSLVPLHQVADIEMMHSSSTIQHFNKERYALVSSFVTKEYNIDKVTTQILDDIEKNIPFPSGYRVVAAGERESREESFGGLGTIIILTVFGLLAILI